MEITRKDVCQWLSLDDAALRRKLQSLFTSTADIAGARATHPEYGEGFIVSTRVFDDDSVYFAPMNYGGAVKEVDFYSLTIIEDFVE